MNLKIILKSVIKSLILIPIFFLISSISSFAELTDKNWIFMCTDKDNKNCQIGILNKVKKKDSNQTQTIATIYIQMGSVTKKKDPANKDDQTITIGQEVTNVPVIFVNLPMNVDLRKTPRIEVDNIKVGNLEFLHCNNVIGCKSSATVSNDVVNLFKKGKNLNIFFNSYVGKIYEIKFPLKSFTKSYSQLSKS